MATNQRGHVKEFIGSNSLQLPNTSTIMIRRNSAIDKKLANKTSTSSKGIMAPSNGLSGQLNTATQLEDQAISPALSSSTTTSPMTPMTPISPHIPTGYTTPDTSFISRFKPLGFAQNHSSIRGQPRSSPKEFYSISDGTPQLPPKPSLSGSFCNKTGKVKQS